MGEIKILLGFEVGTGKEVHMGLHHTVITGMTQLSGKCLTGDDTILLRDGSSITVEEAYRKKNAFNVVSLDDSFKVVHDRVTDVHLDEQKPVFQLTLRDGRSVKLSADHPILTASGWRPAGELNVGDHIAVPRTLEKLEATEDAEDSVLIILGHMIAEGALTISKSSAGYTSSNPKLVQDLDNALKRHDMELHRVGEIDYRIRQQSSSLPYTKGARKGSPGCPSVGEWRHFCETYGLEQVPSREKIVPEFVFRLRNEKVRLFLNRLFGGDGCYYEKHFVSYASTSHRLLRQVQHLLLRFGINSRHTEKKHELRIVREDTNKFLREIGLFGRSLPEREMTHSGTYDVVPVKIPLLKNYRGHWIKAGKRDGFPSRRTLERYATHTGNEHLLQMARSDVYWVQIKEKKDLGVVQTYDVTTENTGNLVVNDVFVHNTTTLEAIISRANRRAIAFKTKRGESGFNSYREIPPFFEERADWQYVSTLLEAVMREKMKFERPWIMKATQGTKTLREVLENVQMLRSEATRSLPENVYTALEEYLKIVVPQIEKLRFSKTLQIIDGINVMDLTEMTLELQGLVIQSTMEYVITNLHETILIVPEAWEHIPQGRNTPVKLYAETFIRKGAAIGNYLFIDSQDIAGIDKMPLRQCNNWILGRQREGHEVERVREQIGRNKIDAEEIRSLPLGHFLAILGDDIKKVYVLPAGVPSKIGRRVAMGDMTVSDAGKYMNNPSGEEETPEAQTGIRRFLPAPTSDRAMRRIEELDMKLARRDNEIALLRTEVDGLRKELITATAKQEQIVRQMETSEQRSAKSQLPQVRPGFTVDDLNQLIDQRMHQIIQYDKPTVFTQVDVSGRFKEMIRERFIREVGLRIRALPPGTIHAAMVVHERRAVKRAELYSFLHGGNGRIADDFYAEIQRLEDTRLVVYSKETGVLHWALGEYLKRELGSMYDEAAVRQAEDYLSSLLLPS
ncbi:MAG: LAGLIDADG family homing endonuclease [Candidatus Bathyarchaeota archaeon]|nr:LAGLIDADG family homing endonuclease [Candidatus Bathyarchaeota archaeon]